MKLEENVSLMLSLSLEIFAVDGKAKELVRKYDQRFWCETALIPPTLGTAVSDLRAKLGNMAAWNRTSHRQLCAPLDAFQTYSAEGKASDFVSYLFRIALILQLRYWWCCSQRMPFACHARSLFALAQ